MARLLYQISHDLLLSLVAIIFFSFASIILCEAVDVSSASEDIQPALILEEDRAYQHLYEVMDKYQKGSTKRLLDSYEATATEDDGDIAWVYDNCLIALVFMSRMQQEDRERAKIILDSLIYCQTHDSFFNDYRLRDAYHAKQLIDDDGKARVASSGSAVGNMSWTIIAWLRYWEMKREPVYLEAAERLGMWIHENCYDPIGPGGYTGGYGGSEPEQTEFPWKSTEQNEDIYVAFMKLHKATGNREWLCRAMEAKRFVKAMWNQEDGHFWTGTIEDGTTINNSALPADVNTWGILTLGEKEKYGASMIWLEENCRVERDGFIGFDFNADQDGVWFEGTAHVILALQVAGEHPKSEAYLGQLRLAQETAANANGKGIVASPVTTSTGFGWAYPNMLHIGATAWYLFAERYYNPFWQIRTDEPIPYDGVTIPVQATLKPAVRTLSFSGYEWTVKTSRHPVGPGPNYFSDNNNNVWVDIQGRLHLQITHRNSHWYCAEVISQRSFGYGTYRFYLDTRVDNLDPNVVLGLFTWSDNPEYSHREIDIECTKWGNAENSTNAQFVVQPYDIPENRLRFSLPSGENTTTHSFTWNANAESVFFWSVKGHDDNLSDPNKIIEAWTCTGIIPEAGGETARMNLWLAGGNAPMEGNEVEIIVRKFEFVPLK